ncbi:hypothetical protein EV138_2617 [Kribbella voronezhensis]|uniref:Uncharacterized protein n=1 Tax=Kribbella voronezhensis TaxID=2512212 RepID=A0A4V3FK74_9ACTN|nr:hypothetical protein EV138_2617 [Kribbella voronezhensis]
MRARRTGALGNEVVIPRDEARTVPGEDGWDGFARDAGGMTGDFLPQRRQASIRVQLLAVGLIIAVAVGAVYALT